VNLRNPRINASLNFMNASSAPRLPALFLALCLCGLIRAAERPNILWISAEDISPNLGCYGDKYADTPNLDALARKGMIFLQAWSNAPVCAPARTTIISGMYPPSTGAEHMRSSVPLPAGCKMFPQYLRETGYYCTNNAKEDYNLQKPDGVWDESSRKAHWRNRRAGQPFFAVFNNEITHESKIRAPGHTIVHDPAKAPVPPYMPDTPEVRHDWAQYYDNITTMDGQSAKLLRELDEAGIGEDTIVFFWGDHGAGMPRSKRWPYNSGLQAPLIAYFPPKWKHLAPKGYEPGARSNERVAFVDFGPTMLSIAGVKTPPQMQGRAFAGEFRAPEREFNFGFRGRMDERQDLVRSATDGRYVYVRQYMPHLPYGQHLNYMFLMPTTQVWNRLFLEGKLNEVQSRFWQPKPVEELYDLRNDPWEIHNLAGSKEHAAVLAKLRKAQADWSSGMRDLGFIPEAERLRAAKGGSPRDAFAADEVYPFAEVMAAATAASDLRQTDTAPLVKLLFHRNAIVRYWGALGLRMRGADAVTAAHDRLAALLNDECPSVRIAAAESLGLFGGDGDRAKILDVLIGMADAANHGNITAVEALNAIDRLGSKAVSLKDKVAALPKANKDEEPRYREYPPRLIQHLTDQAR